MQLATPNFLARMHDQPFHRLHTRRAWSYGNQFFPYWHTVHRLKSYLQSLLQSEFTSGKERAKNAIRNTFTYCRNWQSNSRCLRSLRIASGSSSEKFLVGSSPIKRWLRGQRDRQEYRPLSALLLELVRLILKRRWMDGIEEEYFHTTISVE